MVRHYNRKREKKWDEETMQKAVEHAVRHSNIKASARLFGIPPSTLQDRISGKVESGAKAGHPTVLTQAQEREIVDTCMLFGEWGVGLGRREVEAVIQSYLKSMKQRTPFRNGTPGEGKWSGFLRRHPEPPRRKPQQLQMVRARAGSEEEVAYWFSECLVPVIHTLGLTEKPELIYNVDESGFPLSWTPHTILTKRGQKTPQALVPGSGRENITVQTCVSATGQLLPPYIVYKGERLRADITIGGPLGARYAVSHNGWMTAEAFLDWMRSLFLPSLPPERPILLLLDGHSSHIGYDVRQLAVQNKIHLLKLPPHTTHLLQPLDVGFFNCVKHVWQSIVGDFTRRERRIIAKRDFPALLGEAWSKYKPEWAIGGFKNAGVVPLNPQAIPQSALAPSHVLPPLAEEDQVQPQPEGTLTELLQLGSDGDNITPPGPLAEEVLTAPSAASSSTNRPESTVSLSSSPPSTSRPSSSTPLSATRPPSTAPSSSSPLSTSHPSSSTPLSTTNPKPTVSSATPSSRSAARKPSYTPSSELRDYFAKLLEKTMQAPAPKKGGQRRLVGHGESLTSEEAMERVKAAEEEKQRKEQEKAERAEERKREQKKQQQRVRRKQKKTLGRGNKNT